MAFVYKSLIILNASPAASPAGAPALAWRCFSRGAEFLEGLQILLAGLVDVHGRAEPASMREQGMQLALLEPGNVLDVIRLVRFS